ncbi:MAG: hypothetical protein QQN41_00110 [Nitrosopumilus sp.]
MKRDKLGRFVRGQVAWNKGIKGFGKWNKGLKRTEKLKKELSKIRKKLIKEGKIISLKGIKRPNISGKNHPNWKGGVTTLNERLRKSSMWKIWRELVFLRDNFTCQNLDCEDCEFCHNKIGVMLHPHHIKSLNLYPELAFKVDNGITYCAEFHLKSGLHKEILMQKES